MHGNAKMTGGGLRKKDLKYNKHGKIVSKKVSSMAKKKQRLQKAGYITKKGQFDNVNMDGGFINSINWPVFNNKILSGIMGNSNESIYKIEKDNQPSFAEQIDTYDFFMSIRSDKRNINSEIYDDFKVKKFEPVQLKKNKLGIFSGKWVPNLKLIIKKDNNKIKFELRYLNNTSIKEGILKADPIKQNFMERTSLMKKRQKRINIEYYDFIGNGVFLNNNGILKNYRNSRKQLLEISMNTKKDKINLMKLLYNILPSDEDDEKFLRTNHTEWQNDVFDHIKYDKQSYVSIKESLKTINNIDFFPYQGINNKGFNNKKIYIQRIKKIIFIGDTLFNRKKKIGQGSFGYVTEYHSTNSRYKIAVKSAIINSEKSAIINSENANKISFKMNKIDFNKKVFKNMYIGDKINTHLQDSLIPFIIQDSLFIMPLATTMNQKFIKSLTDDQKKTLIKKIINDLYNLYKHDYYYTDLKLDNVVILATKLGSNNKVNITPYLADVGSIFNKTHLNLQTNCALTVGKARDPNICIKILNDKSKGKNKEKNKEKIKEKIKIEQIYYAINNTIIYFIFDILFNKYTINKNSSNKDIKLYYKRVNIIFKKLYTNSSITNSSILDIYNFIDNLKITDIVKTLNNVKVNTLNNVKANTNSQIKTTTTPSALATTLATTQI